MFCLEMVQPWERKQTDRQKDRQTDATKCIISLASRSIMILAGFCNTVLSGLCGFEHAHCNYKACSASPNMNTVISGLCDCEHAHCHYKACLASPNMNTADMGTKPQLTKPKACSASPITLQFRVIYPVLSGLCDCEHAHCNYKACSSSPNMNTVISGLCDCEHAHCHYKACLASPNMNTVISGLCGCEHAHCYYKACSTSPYFLCGNEHTLYVTVSMLCATITHAPCWGAVTVSMLRVTYGD